MLAPGDRKGGREREIDGIGIMVQGIAEHVGSRFAKEGRASDEERKCGGRGLSGGVRLGIGGAEQGEWKESLRTFKLENGFLHHLV
jgi:hypothetical protein